MTTGPSTLLRRTPWRLVNTTLGVLLVGLVAAVAATVVRSDDGRDAFVAAAAPWDDAGSEELTRRHREVSAAAEAVALAFLEVDHRDMEPLIEEVLARSTGEFAEQYAASREQLVEAARKNRSLSTGKVVAVGVGDLDPDSAKVFVAADSEVENVATEGSTQPRYYRLQIDMVREDGKWLARQVQFVG